MPLFQRRQRVRARPRRTLRPRRSGSRSPACPPRRPATYPPQKYTHLHFVLEPSELESFPKPDSKHERRLPKDRTPVSPLSIFKHTLDRSHSRPDTDSLNPLPNTEAETRSCRRTPRATSRCAVARARTRLLYVKLSKNSDLCRKRLPFPTPP